MTEQIAYVGETASDAYLDVTFYKGWHNDAECDFVRIGIPGDKTVEIDTQATDQHKVRFKRQWKAYHQLKEMDGTPIADWEEVPDGMKRDLEYQGFRYIEQLALAPDAAFARMMGGVTLRNKAQTYLAKGKVSNDAIIKQQALQIEELQEKMALLMEALNNQGDAPKRGRSPKTEE